MRNLRIRTKIFLGMVTILAVFICTAAIVVDRLALRMGERQIRGDLLRGVRAYGLFAQMRGDIIANQVRSIAQTPLLKAVMNIPEVDPATVYYTARDLYEAIDADLMLLIDTESRLLVDVSRRMGHTGEDMSAMLGVAAGLRGVDYGGLWYHQAKLYQVALTPIVIEGQILGLLVLGDYLDGEVVTAIRESTGMDVLMLHEDSIAAESWEDLQRPVATSELDALIGRLRDPDAASKPFRIALGAKDRLAIAVPFAEIEGYVVLSRGLDVLQGEVDLFELSMLGLGAAATLIAVLVSLWLSSRMSRPISALSEAAEEVGAGRLGQRVEVFAGDELGLLAQTFNSMVERIAERTTELEREITERRRAEAERAELEEQLRQSQKLEAIGMLAGGIAHDFNNLLMIVLGYSEMLLMDMEEEDPQRRSIKEINAAGERGAGLVRQLLAFGRRQVLQSQVLDLNALMKDMDNLLRRVIGEDIEFETAYDPDAGLVYADSGQIEQVVMNLVVNARDAMPDGGRLTIAIAAVILGADDVARSQDMRPGPYTMVTVSDTGSGMDAATKERIFEPFFTTKEVDRGTGLGLSTVYGIVKQSEGHLRVQSELGVGTKFEILLPQVSGTVATEMVLAPESESLRGVETILLVEDDVLVRNMVRQVLRLGGYTVMEASDGVEALRVSEQCEGTIDLLLTDVVMPQMGGPELAQQLARARAGIKILYMSGYTDETMFSRSGLTADEVLLQKPFAPEILMGKVREILDG